uniref:Uncharacterized protein n=1 Tax=Panagrolaimus superbus TaxID=310955 RepID=A0A914YKA9_9BILA
MKRILKNLQIRRDLIDQYDFHVRLKLFYPNDVLYYQDKFSFNVRDDAKINQSFLDIFQRQAECNPCGEALFNAATEIVPIRGVINTMIEQLRDTARARSKSGFYGYTQFAGMHVTRTLKLPICTYGTHRSLEIKVAENFEIVEEESSSNLEVTAKSEFFEIIEEEEASSSIEVLKEDESAGTAIPESEVIMPQ